MSPFVSDSGRRICRICLLSVTSNCAGPTISTNCPAETRANYESNACVRMAEVDRLRNYAPSNRTDGARIKNVWQRRNGSNDEQQRAKPGGNFRRLCPSFPRLERHHVLAVVVCLQKMFTPLHCAASSGTVEVVKVLLQRGANKLAKNKVPHLHENPSLLLPIRANPFQQENMDNRISRRL